MNPRQRRGLVYLVLASVLGVVVFGAVSLYVRSVSNQVGSLTTVYRARAGIDAYTELTEDLLEPVQEPMRWTSATSRVALDDLVGRRVPFRLEAGTVLTSDMLVAESDLDPDEREIAINVDPVTGIGGRMQVGDKVDVYATFADVAGVPKQVRVLVEDVRIVSIGGSRTVTEEDGDSGLTSDEQVAVTLALSPDDALAVTYANAFASEVRLVGLPTDVGTDRDSEDKSDFDADDLGGTAVPEEGS